MTAKRAPSLATLLTKASKAGAALRITLPDGTVIETLTGGNAPSPMTPKALQNEWDEVLPDGHARN